MTVRVFTSPHRYVQGPGALDMIGALIAARHTRAAVLIDGVLFDTLHGRISGALTAAGVVGAFTPVTGEVTRPRIDDLATQLRPAQPTVVVAVGGGKTLDTGKGVARRLDARVVTVPTIASNDGPTSRVIALYDEDHHLIDTLRMTENPESVIVDTQLVAQAPWRFLASGIGDALAKRFEADACRRGGGATSNGTRPLHVPFVIAEACYDVLMQDSAAAVADVGRQLVSPSLERVVEAIVLMSGLAFENGGLSLAHAMTRGLMSVPGARDRLHGFHVAYGLLVQLAHEGQPFFDPVREFLPTVGLPVFLEDLGAESSPATIETIVQGTLAAPHMVNCVPTPTAHSLGEAIARVQHHADGQT